MTEVDQVIDLNCDLGEGTTEKDCIRDAEIMRHISSCNIACGGHAGNELTMRLSLQNAVKNNLKIGAHPGYEDKANFGRVSLEQPLGKLIHSINTQIKTLIEQANCQDIKLHHIKFHGALYNDVENNKSLADAMANFLFKHYQHLKVFGLAGGFFEKSCTDIGLTFVPEGFIDRRYLSNGKLTPRTMDGAVIHNISESLAQAKALASRQPVVTINQQSIALKAETLCLHGDNPDAVNIAKSLVETLKNSGIAIQ